MTAPMETWPLQRGDTLSNHDWFPFFGHRFLSSGFVAQAVIEGRRADLGTALILWAEAMRQDPAGTLPDCDVQLAALARFATVADWRAVRAGVLHGWVSVRVEDARCGPDEIRLGHPRMLQGVVEQMHRRKVGRDNAREAGRLAVRKSRIIKKMEEMGLPDYLRADRDGLRRLAEWFEETGAYVTAENLRGALAEVLQWSGDVVPLRRGER